MYADAAAAAAVVPAETAALPGGSAAQREVFKKSQQKQREAAVWRQTAACICANYALYWRREGAEFPVAPTAGDMLAALHVAVASRTHQSLSEMCRRSWQCIAAALIMIGCIGAAADLGQTPQAAVGVLGLHPETLQRALTDHALGMLLPPTLWVTFQPCDPSGGPPQPPSVSESQLGSSSLHGSAPDQSSTLAPQSRALSTPSGQQFSRRISQQSSQQASCGLDESSRPSDSGYGWRRLSGGPDGAGFGGNRGFLWAMVAPVGVPIPMTMKVR